MKLAISNLAWQGRRDEDVLSLLKKYRFDAVDLAPGIYFPHLPSAQLPQLVALKQWWQQQGFEIYALQGLFFGSQGFNLFSTDRREMLNWMSAVCRIASTLSAQRLVFGSPRQRDRGQLDSERAQELALEFFSQLAAIAHGYGLVIALEANPACYGANFLTRSDEVAQFVRRLNHSAVRMQLDTGTLTINREDAETVIRKNHDIIAHVHISEPHLVPLGQGGCSHQVIAPLCRHYLPDHVLAIEVCHGTGQDLTSIESTIQLAVDIYR